MSKTFRGVVGVAATVALLGGLLPTAFAVDTTSPVIDTDAKGSIVIHKRAGLESNVRATGKELNDVSGTPLAKAKFKIERVKKDANTEFDFSKSADLEAAVALNAATVAGESNRLVEVLAPTATDAEGKVSKNELPVGVYLVTETEAPEGYVKGAPFLVFIPTSDNDAATADKWIYDVHVYPKNTNVPVVKKVEDAGKHEGDDIVYTIETGAVKPRDEQNGKIKRYIIKDTIYNTEPSVRFADAASVLEVKIGNQAPLTAGADYKVELDAAGKNVTITFLSDKAFTDLTNAVKADPAVKVSTKLKMAVGADFNIKKGIENGAELKTAPNVDSDDDTTTIPGNTVKSYFGKLKIVKKGNKNGALLEGAKFEVYNCNAAGTAPEGDKLFPTGGPNQDGIFVTGANGEVVFPVMHVTNIADNAPVPTVKKYCVKEVEAPAGYALPTNPVTPIDFKLTDFPGQADDNVTTLEMAKEIENEKRITPELPLTGGAGIALFILGGAGLIGAGTMAARRNSKKNA